MKRPLSLSALQIFAAAALTISGASAGTRVHVDLAGPDPGAPKRARPAFQVRVDASSQAATTSVTNELTRELTHQVDAREVAPGEVGDLALTVTVDPPRSDGAVQTIRFEALLRSAGGRRLWRIEGRSDTEGAPLDAAVYEGISRNVVSALVHDGWIHPLDDPNDPPPPPPVVRIEDARQ